MTGIAIVAITGLVFIKNYSEEKTNAGQDLLTQNVEALSDIENPLQWCDNYCVERYETDCIFKHPEYGYKITCEEMYAK